jgi:hypothetical protein
MKVSIFITCIVDQFFPHVGAAASPPTTPVTDVRPGKLHAKW